MKEKELNELLDKAIGTKGNLRIPSYWMRKVFSGLMEWCKTLTPKLDISKSDIPTKISQLENDVDLTTQSYVDSITSQIEGNCKSHAETYTNNAITSAITTVLNKEV